MAIDFPKFGAMFGSVFILFSVLLFAHGDETTTTAPVEEENAPLPAEEVWSLVPAERLPSEHTVIGNQVLLRAAMGNWTMDPTHQLRFFTIPQKKDQAMLAMPIEQLPKYMPDLSICYWIRPRDSQENCVFWHAAQGNVLEILTCVLKKGDDIGVFFQRSQEEKVIVSVTNTTELNKLDAKGWMHICTMWSSVQGKWQVILNGKTRFQGENLATGKLVNPFGWQSVGMGPNKIPFVGDLAELHVWSRILDHKEVYLAALGLIEGDAVGWKTTSMSLLNGAVLQPKVHLPWRYLFQF